MLALKINIGIRYDPGLTTLSFIIPIIAARIAFQVGGRWLVHVGMQGLNKERGRQINNFHRINHFGINYVALDNNSNNHNNQALQNEEAGYTGHMMAGDGTGIVIDPSNRHCYRDGTPKDDG